MSSIDNDELAAREMKQDLNNSGQSLTGGRKKIGRYEVVRLLGRGAFGTVKLALDPETSIFVAVKILKHRKAQNEREMEMIEREKKALMMLNHPNIVKLLEIIEDEEKQITYLVFEYVRGGELFGYIVSNGRLSELVARKFIRQIVSALEYCHFNLIVHRDLKPENLLLDDANNIKITDFGLANFITPKKFSTFCGSLHYAAPEILHGQSYGGPPVDVYALGVILYCLVNGKQPFNADTPYEMIKRISTGLHYDVEVSKELKELIHKMLATDPKKRISLADIRVHPWVLKDHSEPPVSYLPKIRPVTQVDEAIMLEVVALGFEDKVSHRRAIIKNKNKQVVAAYQLCLSRRTLTPANSANSDVHPPASLNKKLKNSLSNQIPKQQLNRSPSNENSDLVSAKSRKSLTESQHKLKKSKESKKDTLKTSIDNFDQQLDQLMNSMLKSSDEDQRVIRQRSGSTQTSERGHNLERNRTPERSSKRRRSSVSYGTPTNSPKGPLETLANRLTRYIRDSSVSESNSRRSSCDNSTAEDFSTSGVPIQFEQRNIKLSSSFNCDTTSSESTREIKKKIISAAQKCLIHCEKLSRYEFKLTLLNDDVDQPSLEKIVFYIEIVKMKDFKNLKGLKFKRLEGDIWQYKNIATNFLNELNL